MHVIPSLRDLTRGEKRYQRYPPPTPPPLKWPFEFFFHQVAKVDDHLNSVSFIALGSESQISVLKQCQSSAQMSGDFFFVGGWWGVCAEAKNWKKNFITHFAGFNFSRLLLAFILKYYPILHVVER